MRKNTISSLIKRLFIRCAAAGQPVVVFPLFALGVFLYLLLRIDISLAYVAQDPLFQSTSDFFLDRASIPGGIVDWLAALLEQFFTAPAVAAAIVTIVLLLIALGTRSMLRRIAPSRNWLIAPLLPALFGLSLLSNYYHPFSLTLGCALALAAFNLHAALPRKAAAGRVAQFTVIAAALYYCACGDLFLFAALCLLNEIFVGRQYGAAALQALITAAMPFVAARCLFLVSVSDAFLHEIPFTIIGCRPAWLPIVLYSFFPAALLVAAFAASCSESCSTVSHLFHGAVNRIAGLAAFSAAVVLCMFSFNRVDALSLRFCRMTDQGDWEGIIGLFQASWLDNRVSNFAVAQALFHEGQLPAALFAVPQHFGDRGIFLFADRSADQYDQDPFFFSRRADLYFKLGLVNEAEQWGCEALGVRGGSPRVLKRLALIYALKGDRAAMRACLAQLETMPPGSGWAHRFERENGTDGSDPSGEGLQQIQASMPTEDFIRTSYTAPGADLDLAVHQHPINRMAFEYGMAAYLLQGNLQKIPSLMLCGDSLGYGALPRPWQEALVMLEGMDYPLPSSLAARIDPATMNDYLDFHRIVENRGGNFAAAESEVIGRYWNTFWYYCFYVLPAGSAK
jgi:hypothetical protein